MPKGGGKGHSSKKPVKVPVTEDDGSNIVFDDGKTRNSKKNNSTETETKQQTSSGNADSELPKKPDTRQLIGGASWTGKLPVNILSEHCQKQKWCKPEYTMSKTSHGFLSSVMLRSVDPKTKEDTTLPPFVLPSSYKEVATQATAVEARHFAATYALFRVCNMRNIHMMLPPTYRDLWKNEFESSKKEDVSAGRGWMYEADPFLAKQKQDEAHTLREKKRTEDEKRRTQQADQSVSLSLGSSVNRSCNVLAKGWTRAPKLEMGKQNRAQIESLVQRNAVWNPHGLDFPTCQSEDVVRELTTLGFRRSHAEEAITECKDREEALEWLLIHVPEDDLPRWCLPEGYAAGISMASGNPKRDATIGRLAEVGYSVEICGKFLTDCDGNEAQAAEALQTTLAMQAGPHMSHMSLDDTDSSSVWREEQETLSAILGDRLRRLPDFASEIHLELEDLESCILRVRKSHTYPQAPPIIGIITRALPAYIRLSILRQVLEYSQARFTGEPMIFNIVDWLEREIPRIVENPGKLRYVASAVTGESQARQSTERRPTSSRAKPLAVSWQSGSPQSVDLYRRWQSRQTTAQQQKMLTARRRLPAWKLRGDIVQTVNEHQVTIISGETGSGKSTQSVQFILDDLIQRQLGAAANIICTQPRRISALGLADRVSDERCMTVGDEVGYIIKGESKVRPHHTKITFVTTGVLLRRLQTSGGHATDVLAAIADVSHVVVDEVHERSLDTDFLLILLRDILPKRRDLKVILMSATLDAAVFENYFGQGSSVGKVNIEGRTFPVDDFYLDDVVRLTGFVARGRYSASDDVEPQGSDPDVAKIIQGLGMKTNYDLIASCVQSIDDELGSDEGGILIFLPGTLEISRTLDAIRRLPNMHALPLHASLMPSEQRRVFPPPPRGKRKVIAATNVAETSITIEDIVVVIDCGKVKETSFNPQNNMVKLEEVWASRAACKQRRGRAGRVRPGQCYKLYTRNLEAKMAERPEPEIRRVPLEQLCLSVKATGVQDVPTFLASALTPPESLAVGGAVDLLRRMGALDGNELTALGRHLSMIPADLRCGKLMVYGATFGCFEACLNISAILTARSPFVSPQDKRAESKAARASFAPNQGDLLCDLKAYEEWANIKSHSSYRDLRLWCEDHFLSTQTLNDIFSNRAQYLSSLQDAGFIPTSYNNPDTHHPSLNAHNTNAALIRALIAGAFNPQLARIEFPDKKFATSVSGAVAMDPEARTIKFFNQENGRVFVHPSSTLFDAQSFTNNAVYMSYFNKMATAKVFVRELTPFGVYALLLFGGPIVLDTGGRGLVVDGWLRLRGWARIGVLVGRLRGMLDEVLARKIEEPGVDVAGSEVVGVVRKLVELDGMDR
ncbi:MAG: hypothetical protein LQ350_005900 [Teloschistes chrysophthalmus]|nr:MAG: hypothetical protein LQ350_005900 [Niorma chrysophthalma]